MAGTCEARLTQLGLTLPPAPAAVASYVPFTRSGSILFVSGQIPLADGKPAFVGRLGAEVTLEQGQAAARLCALNALAQLKAAAGDLDNVVRVLRLVGYVACTPDFLDAHKVMNGASELLATVLGEAGRHARSAVGVAVLPLGVPAEVELTVEIAA
jgi:enamine deaminase RidA (YjgF/YER057c/UK114 family)